MATLPNGDIHVALLVPADLAARQGLSGTPGPRLVPAHQRAAPRSVPDPRDQFATPRQRLAAGILPRFP